MSEGRILWYVHDQGSGHVARARAVLPHLRSPTVVAVGPHQSASAARQLPCPVVALPGDTPPAPVPTTGPWHHAPRCREVRRRALALADCVARFDCTTAVVDVSVEVVALARLLGLRVVAVRQSGRRGDVPHGIAHDSADVVWIPQHPMLEPDAGPVDDRWRFTGAFSRFDDQLAPAPRSGRRRRRVAALVVGAGGTAFDAAAWCGAFAPPGWRVVIAGLADCWSRGGVRSVGRIDDVDVVLRAADVVVASAGWGNVADAAAIGARLVAVPEPRPFDEQAVRADALAAAGVARRLAAWPTPAALGDVLTDAMSLDRAAWRAVYDGNGARRAAELVEAVHAS